MDHEAWIDELHRLNVARAWQFAERLTVEQYDRLCEVTARALVPEPSWPFPTAGDPAQARPVSCSASASGNGGRCESMPFHGKGSRPLSPPLRSR